MRMRNVTGCILVICLIVIGFSFLAGCTRTDGGPGVVNESGIVKTDAGSVAGTEQDGLRVYTGIPFAAPPVGDLRWKPPAPVQHWDGVKQTTAFSPACPQPPAADPALNQSEDCLYLNVWTPAKTADEKLPVMVFLYGGAFGKIAGSMPLYNGTALAEKGIVVVTTNYRVGALGFLAHPELDAESSHNVSGNYGLLDQIATLQWVQKNIDRFGGDPSRVTVFGQSAGGESILIDLASPQTKGLFSQAIVESGTFWKNGAEIDALYTKADAEQLGKSYAQDLGYPGPGAIAGMRKLPYQVLTNATPWPPSSFEMVNSRHFEPTIDGWLIPDAPENIFRLHQQNPVPLMIGNNADDGITLAANAGMSVSEYRAFIQGRFGNESAPVLEKYPANSTDEVQLRLAQIMTDYDFTDAVKFVANSMADTNTTTYRYQYSYVIPGLNFGAFHGSETILLFNVPMRKDPATESVMENLVDLWSRFAKTGDPNGGMNVTWPKYTRDQGQYLDIGAIPSVQGPARAATSPGYGDWKFVVFADSPDPAGNTTTGVSPALIPLAKAIAAEKPDLAIYGGDLINGWGLTNESPMEGNYTGQFRNWMADVAPIHNYTTGTGIPLYVVRGNHEEGPDPAIATPLLNAYLATAASGMPANGPPGEEKLTYSFTHKGAKFLAVDEYVAHNGKKETVNQTWVDGQLMQDTRPFIFVFGHSPVYEVVNDTEGEDIFALAAHPPERDAFWKSMVTGNVSAYFCGHAHLYTRGESQGVTQVVSGNAGAHAIAFDPTQVDSNLTLEYPQVAIAAPDQPVGYLVITVQEDTGTFDGVQKVLNPVTGAWETGDTFTLHAR